MVPRNVWLSALSLCMALATLAYRGVLFIAANMCGPFGGPAPGSAPLAGTYLALIVATASLAVAAMALEIWRRSRGVRHGELEDAAIRLAVFGPALSALALLAFALRPVVCM